MSAKNTRAESDRRDPIVVEAQRYRNQRDKNYREQALKIYPWICAHCGREFSGKKLRELTVHHKDHNHDNNPADGSNWELLCLYCHAMSMRGIRWLTRIRRCRQARRANPRRPTSRSLVLRMC